MEVYHNGNFHGTGRTSERLSPIPIRQSFLWEGQELYIPAIYLGQAGAVLDICAKFSMEDMSAFLRKWDKERRLSLRTPEDYELLEADNPSCRDFLAEMSLDGSPLQLGMGCCLNWYPEEVFRMGNEEEAPAQEEEWANDANAELLMENYGCDRASCWHFGRFSYHWKGDTILSPKKIALTLRQKMISVTACRFTTTPSCKKTMYKAIHPITGQEYTLTLLECEPFRHSFEGIGKKGILYPEYSQLLSYSISPEISRELFDIRDCGENDHPKAVDSSQNHGKEDGPTAVFMAGKSSNPERRTAVSALHFEPVEEVRWRAVFQIQPKPDIEISFDI